jgi:flagellar protein FliO/FliZ
MPQWLTNLGSPDLHGPWLIVMAAAAALLILYFLYRFVFAHRLRVPAGGRTRQPRLGLVDAFSLDGQRQLVLVRRDNVEHLIMIGGPTDVLVESQIIRVSAPTSAATRDREVVAAVKAPPPAPPVPVASPASAPPLPPAERPVLSVAAAAVAPPPPAPPPPQGEGPHPRIVKSGPPILAEPPAVLRRPEPAPKQKEVTPAPRPETYRLRRSDPPRRSGRTWGSSLPP